MREERESRDGRGEGKRRGLEERERYSNEDRELNISVATGPENELTLRSRYLMVGENAIGRGPVN